MADQKSTFDESQLPEWAVHGTESQEELDSFFNSPADRGRAETAFAIPRGESDAADSDRDAVSAAAQTVADGAGTPSAASFVSAHAEEFAMPSAGASANGQRAHSDEQIPVSAVFAGASPEGAEAQSVWEAIEDAAREDAELIGAEAKSAVGRVQDPSGESAAGDEGADSTAGDESAASAVGDEGGDDGGGFGFGKKENDSDAPTPRREDFAKFRCIYESKDGQLALYEDEHGHLTAVNTNRFV